MKSNKMKGKQSTQVSYSGKLTVSFEESYLNPPEFNEWGIFLFLTIVNFNFFSTLNQ